MYNQSYKNWHKPVKNRYDENGKLKKGQTHQGYLHETYVLRNPSKYIGNPSLIIYRSGWELSFCKWCDITPSVVRWSSEPIKIPYYDRISKLAECKKQGLDPNDYRNWVVKNYNTDFWVEIKRDDNIQKMFIEIKPSEKLKKPIPPPDNAPLKDIKRFNIKAKEYIINEAKYAAMNAWATKYGAKFYVFTENTLQNLIGKF